MTLVIKESTTSNQLLKEMEEPLLRVNNLSVSYQSDSQAPVVAVDGVSFFVNKGETLGIVGESGCGKSSVGLSLLRLMSDKKTKITGDILFRENNVLAMSKRQLSQFRGRKMSMILQDLTALNPVFSVGNQLYEALRCHEKDIAEQDSQSQGSPLSAEQIKQRAIQALERVNIAGAEERLRNHPHQLSGGMRQRVAGAIAMACEPDLLIADEPTTALDVTVQAKYLELLKTLQTETGIAIVMITHDFGVVASLCDRLCVMYAGQIVEQGSVEQLFDNPSHWYTHGLLNSRLSLDDQPERLAAIPGFPPDLREPQTGCRFAPRCSNAQADCLSTAPSETTVEAGHTVRCLYPRSPE